MTTPDQATLRQMCIAHIRYVDDKGQTFVLVPLDLLERVTCGFGVTATDNVIQGNFR